MKKYQIILQFIFKANFSFYRTDSYIAWYYLYFQNQKCGVSLLNMYQFSYSVKVWPILKFIFQSKLKRSSETITTFESWWDEFSKYINTSQMRLFSMKNDLKKKFALQTKKKKEFCFSRSHCMNYTKKREFSAS